MHYASVNWWWYSYRGQNVAVFVKRNNLQTWMAIPEKIEKDRGSFRAILVWAFQVMATYILIFLETKKGRGWKTMWSEVVDLGSVCPICKELLIFLWYNGENNIKIYTIY